MIGSEGPPAPGSGHPSPPTAGPPRRAARRFVLGSGAALLAVLLGLVAAWQTVPGRVKLADVYWEIALALRLVDPSSYVGPHLWAVAVHPDGSRLAVAGMVRDALQFDASGEPLPPLDRHGQWVMEVLWSPTGRWFASTSFDGAVRVLETATGELVYASAGSDVAYTVAFHPVAPVLAWGAYDGSVRLVDLTDGQPLRSIPANEGGVLFTRFTPDGGQLVTAGEDGRVLFFDPESGALVQEVKAHAAGITTVAFSPDGSVFATGGDDAAVRLWDRSGALLREAFPHAGWVNFSAFLDADRWLTVGTDDDVFVWSRRGGPPTRLEGPTDWGMCVRVFPDGSRFASVGKDGVVHVWDAATLAKRATIPVFERIRGPGWRWPAL